jgi:hypothetical protein
LLAYLGWNRRGDPVQISTAAWNSTAWRRLREAQSAASSCRSELARDDRPEFVCKQAPTSFTERYEGFRARSWFYGMSPAWGWLAPRWRTPVSIQIPASSRSGTVGRHGLNGGGAPAFQPGWPDRKRDDADEEAHEAGIF